METAINSANISLTQGAISEINRLIQSNTTEHKNLRIGVKGGGCSGLTYIMEFDAKQEDDEVIEIGAINLIMKPAHAIYLSGMEIDFSTGLDNRGFTFKNPNASSTCGCGTSFAV